MKMMMINSNNIKNVNNYLIHLIIKEIINKIYLFHLKRNKIINKKIYIKIYKVHNKHH
jgi:hypothetical protein